MTTIPKASSTAQTAAEHGHRESFHHFPMQGTGNVISGQEMISEGYLYGELANRRQVTPPSSGGRLDCLPHEEKVTASDRR